MEIFYILREYRDRDASLLFFSPQKKDKKEKKLKDRSNGINSIGL